MHLFVGEPADKVSRHCMRHYDTVCPTGGNECTGQMHGLVGMPIVYLWIPDWPVGKLCTGHIGILVHECIHAATHILDACGGLQDMESRNLCHEAQAYLAEFYVRTVIDGLFSGHKIMRKNNGGRKHVKK